MSKSIPILSFDQVVDRLAALKQPYHQNYLAMYSSWYGGIITDPALMMVPIDDHLVHRGDGIFEAFKCVGGNLYALSRHLERMERSAAGISLSLPMSRNDLQRTILATIRAAGASDCFIRLFLARGPGGFSTNPYECPSSQVYVVIATLSLPPMVKYEEGVSLKSSHIPIKKACFANIKSCNYLPNVLMKKEAEDARVDYTVSIDEQGFLGEGSTENVGMITREREFLVPRFAKILRGITVSRMMELAESLVVSGDLARVGEMDITPEQAYQAEEIMVFGTSFDVLPVVTYDGHSIGKGLPGAIYRKFRQLFREDLRSGPGMLTSVKES